MLNMMPKVTIMCITTGHMERRQSEAASEPHQMGQPAMCVSPDEHVDEYAGIQTFPFAKCSS